MDNLIDHVGHVLSEANKYWHIILGGFATIYGAYRLHLSRVSKEYATKDELRNCHDKLQNEIYHNREINTKEHSAIKDLMIQLHSKDHE